MDRLSSMDSMFLDIEKSGPSVAVGSAMMIEGKAPSLTEVRSYFRERIKDMDVNGIAASLNFGTLIGLDGLMFCSAPDKTYAVNHVQAYNDYHWYQWCEAHPGRFIMNGILPAWDIDATVAEIQADPKVQEVYLGTVTEVALDG